VPAESSAAGTEIQVVIRGNEGPAKIVPTPFYKRAK
jgi:glycine cleavage system aminomethyltransferase T